MNQKGIAPLLIILSIAVLLSVGGGAYMLGKKSSSSNPDVLTNETISDNSLTSAIPPAQSTIKPSATPIIRKPLPSPSQILIPTEAIAHKKLSVNCKMTVSDEKEIIDYICSKENVIHFGQIDPVEISTITLNGQTIKTFSVVYGPEVDWGGVRNTLNGYTINGIVYDAYDKNPYAKLARTNAFLSSPQLLQALKNDNNSFLDTVLGILIKDEQDTPEETLAYIYFLKKDEFSRITLEDCTYTYIVNDYIKNTDVPKEILEDLLSNSSASPNPNSLESRNNFVCDPNKTVRNILQMNLKSQR